MDFNANWSTRSTGSGADGAGDDREDDGGRRQDQLDLMLRRYGPFKLYLNKAQSAALDEMAILAAEFWNACLEYRMLTERNEAARLTGGYYVRHRPLDKHDRMTGYAPKGAIAEIRRADERFRLLSASTMGKIVNDLNEATKAYRDRRAGRRPLNTTKAKVLAKRGRRMARLSEFPVFGGTAMPALARSFNDDLYGYPRFKSPQRIADGEDCSIPYRDGSFSLDQRGRQNWRLTCYGFKSLRMRGKFPVDLSELELRDMRLVRRGGVWEVSIAVRMEARREKIATTPAATVEFDLIDKFASVKIGEDGQCLPGWEAEFLSADEEISKDGEGATEQSGHVSTDFGSDGRMGSTSVEGHVNPDKIQSERDRRFKKCSNRWRREKKRMGRLKAREARRRKEALHLWTTKLLAGVSELTVVCPPIKDSTQSARGDEKFHGAAVKPVAMLNRHVLAQAPAMAIQMLEYKSAEAGIPFVSVPPDEHALAIGRELPAVTKAVRKMARRIRKELA